MMWKGISCVSGYPRKQNPSFWMGQITHCVCKTANQRESSLHVCPSRDWEYSGLSLWAGSGEHWPYFHAVLILCNYTYPWSFSFSPFIFFKTSVLIFSSIFHVSPYSLSFCFFFFLLIRNCINPLLSVSLLLWKIESKAPYFQISWWKFGLEKTEKTCEACLAPKMLSRLSFLSSSYFEIEST